LIIQSVETVVRMMDRALKEVLQTLTENPIQWDCLLSGYTSFRIGGPAAALVVADNCQELQGLLSFFKKNGLRWRVIGKGTNLLVSDAGFDGVIVVLGSGFKNISFQEDGTCVSMHAGGGCTLANLVSQCGERGFSGLEFTCGIPGTIGGAVVMNAGAWGKELADVLIAVTVMTSSGAKRFTRQQLHFSYRYWLDYDDNKQDRIVTEVEIQLSKANPDEIRQKCSTFLLKRRERQPKGQPNAGSFFKNPANDSAGRLIEQSGCKGMQVGGAMVSPIHANFFVNTGGATAADVVKLMDIVQKKVQTEKGILLEPEVHFL
jgi:UDP-N-acetylmuramate dehydrogenase